MKLMYGAAALFVAAAFVEAFWSSIATLPFSLKIIVGLALWLLLAFYLFIPGRSRAA